MSAEKPKPVKDEVVEDSDSDDNVPIAIAAKKHQHQQPPPLKKEPKQESFADEGGSLSDLKKKKVKDASGPKKEIANGNLKPVKEEKKSTSVKPSKVKKQEEDAYEPSLKKKKKIKEELKRVKEGLINTPQKSRKQANGKREKKVYSLPGQKHDPPPERDPLRIFYESLYEQVPNSEMAAVWMMEWGLLPANIAAKVFEKKKARQQLPKSPVKPAAKSAATIEKKRSAKVTPKEVKKESSMKSVMKTTTVKKRKAGDTSSDEGDDDDDDFMPLSLKKAKKKLKMSD